MRIRSIAGAAILLVLACTGAVAQYMGPYVLPPREIVRSLQSQGFQLTSRLMRSGMTYHATAVNRAGTQLRLVIDGRHGEVISVRPLAAHEARPRAGAPPRPQAPVPTAREPDVVGTVPPDAGTPPVR